METEAIQFEVGDDHVATITLDRPDALNSFDDVMARELRWAWETARDTDAVHAVVVRAAGERAFSSGLDLRSDTSWFFPDNPWNAFDPGEWLSPKTHIRCWKPVVAAVHGICAGGGQYFVNEADIIICADDAQFFDPHVSGGMVSALEPIGLLARGVPLGDVLRWALVGNRERITADTALRLGIVTEVTPRAELWDRAHALAAEIAARPTRAVQGTVRAIWESLDMTRSMALRNGIAYPTIGNDPIDPSAPRRKEEPRLR